MGNNRTTPCLQSIQMKTPWFVFAHTQQEHYVNRHLHMMARTLHSQALSVDKKWEEALSFDQLSYLLSHHLLKLEPSLRAFYKALKLQRHRLVYWFFRHSIEHDLRKLKQKQAELEVFKNTLIETCLFRALHYIQHRNDRHICPTSTKTLSDDQRLKLCDILSHLRKNDLLIAPIIQKNRQQAFTKPEAVVIPSVPKLYQNTLNHRPALLSLPFLKHPFLLPFKKKIESGLQLTRYILYPVSSLLIYSLLASPLYQVLHFALPAATWVASIMFYGLIFAPFAFPLVRIANRLYDKGQRFLNRQEQKHLAIAKVTLEQSEQTLLQMQAGITDTPFYNIEALSSQLKQLKTDLRHCLNNLQQSKVQYPAIKQANEAMRQQIKAHQSALETQTAAFASHLLARLKQDLTGLQMSPNQTWVHLLPTGQLNAYHQFLSSHAPDKVSSFESVTSLWPLFEQKLRQGYFSTEDNHAHPHYPWGQYKPLVANLTGWQHLFRFANQSTGQQVMAVLSAKAYSQQQWRTLCADINKTAQPNLLAAIQQVLFDQLCQLPPPTVHFLSPQQKNIIRRWGEQNQDEINGAIQTLAQFLDNPSAANAPDLTERQAARFVGMLEGARSYYALQGESFRGLKALEQAIERCNGRSMHLFYGLRFFEQAHKQRLAKVLLAKRLDWLFRHPNTRLTQACQQLFHADLNLDIDRLVQEQSRFKDKHPGLRPMLTHLCQHGIIAQLTLETYLSAPNADGSPRRKRHARLS